MSDPDAAVAGGLLRQLRESRGWSWADLTRALRDTARQLQVTSLQDRQVASIQRTVARWESPTDRTSPGERYQVLLAHLYACTSTGMLKLGPGSDFAVLADALRGFGVPEHRIGQSTEMVTQDGPNSDSGGFDLVTATPRRTLACHDLVHELTTKIISINEEIGSTPLVRLQLALAPVVETCQYLIRPALPSPGEDVLTLATSALGLAARLAFETVDDEAANALYCEATDVAGRAP